MILVLQMRRQIFRQTQQIEEASVESSADEICEIWRNNLQTDVPAVNCAVLPLL